MMNYKHIHELFWIPNIVLGNTNARVEIIERHQSLKSHTGLTNSLTEIYAEKNSWDAQN